MNELSKYLVEQMLLEDKNPIKKVIVIYGGRFQPFHKGHYATYQHLVKKFGKDNVFISTSNKVEKPKSPFSFNEKKKIMTSMFGIPSSKIVQVKNNYAPKEILDKYDKDSTAFISVVGEKDATRLGGKYFRPYKGVIDVGYEDGGYVYASPAQPNPISGTDVRNGLSLGSDDQKEQFFTQRAYGKFNKTIFKMITDKLNEGIHIPKEIIEDWLIKEGTRTGTGQVDDGPNFFFPNFETFSKVNINRATKIGYEVINMIMNKDLEDYYEHPTYPNGPVKAVTPFPAGVIGKTTATNQVDIYSTDAYSKWYKHVTRKFALAGYELVQTTLSKQDDKEEKQKSGEGAKNLKSLKEQFEKALNEAITIPVEIGDTVLMGKFKNKKVVVKSIGKDEYGMPTINGKKVATFRLVREGKEVIFKEENEGSANTIAGTAVRCEKCNHSWEIEVNDVHPYLCHSCGWDSQQQEYDFDEFDSWREKMGLVEMSKSTLDRIEKFAEKQLSPEDIEFTKHFFDRINDPRNGKEISDAELTGFFKRLSKFKKKFKEFLEKYQQIVVKDKRTDINIPFVQQANRIIAKTVMRKDNFQTSNPTLAFEQLAKGMSLRDIADKHGVSFEELKDQARKGVKVEMEHTLYPSVAYNIVKDHLVEDPKYYDKLATIEELAPHGYPDQKWMDNHEKEMKRLRTQLDKQHKKVYEASSNAGYTTDGEPDGIFVTDGKTLNLGPKIDKPDYWFDAGGYTQLHFPKSDYIFGKEDGKDTTSQQRKVIRKILNINQSELEPHNSDEVPESAIVKENIENSLQSKYKVDLDVYEYPTHLELRRIVVPQDKRGQGIGSKVMNDLIKYAQSNKKDLFTTPDSSFGGSKPRLVQFYKSFGFKDNKGSNRDFRSKETMVRLSENQLNENAAISLLIRLLIRLGGAALYYFSDNIIDSLTRLIKPGNTVILLKRLKKNKQFYKELGELIKKDRTGIYDDFSEKLLSLPSAKKELEKLVKDKNLSDGDVSSIKSDIQHRFRRSFLDAAEAIKRQFPQINQERKK